VSLTRIQVYIIASWIVLATSVVALSIVFKIPASAGATADLLILGSAVSTMLIVVFHGAPLDTIAQMPYKGEHEARRPGAKP
jgi:hypothetical protein